MFAQHKGALLLLLTNLCYLLSHSLTKDLGNSISVPGLMFIRFIAGPIILLPFFLSKTISFQMGNWPIMLLRTVFGLTAMAGYFWALVIGDPGKVTLIFMSSSLWAYLLAKLLFNESPSWQTKCLTPVAFIGLFCVIQPKNFSSISPADGITLIAALLNAGVILTLKSLRKTEDSNSIIMVNYSLSAILVLPILFLAPSHVSIHTVLKAEIALLIILMGAIGFIGNWFMTIAFRYTSATVAGNLLLLIVPLMYISGILFFSETVNTLGLFGIALTLTSLGLIAKYQ